MGVLVWDEFGLDVQDERGGETEGWGMVRLAGDGKPILGSAGNGMMVARLGRGEGDSGQVISLLAKVGGECVEEGVKVWG